MNLNANNEPKKSRNFTKPIEVLPDTFILILISRKISNIIVT